MVLNTLHAKVQDIMASAYYLQCYSQNSQWGNFSFSLHANLVVIDVNILELLAGDINWCALIFNLCHIQTYSIF